MNNAVERILWFMLGVVTAAFLIVGLYAWAYLAGG